MPGWPVLSLPRPSLPRPSVLLHALLHTVLRGALLLTVWSALWADLLSA
jgi:hypothetical protein